MLMQTEKTAKFMKWVIVAIQALFLISLFSFAVLQFTQPVYADVLSERIGELEKADDETDLINGIIGIALPVGVLALIGLSIYAGYIMITSQGNPEKLNEAREVITNAIIGFALIALSVSILLLLQNVLGLEDLL